jgi:hypothetical protein
MDPPLNNTHLACWSAWSCWITLTLCIVTSLSTSRPIGLSDFDTRTKENRLLQPSSWPIACPRSYYIVVTRCRLMWMQETLFDWKWSQGPNFELQLQKRRDAECPFYHIGVWCIWNSTNCRTVLNRNFVSCFERIWNTVFYFHRKAWHSFKIETGWRSRYSHWLRAGQPRGRSLSPGRATGFLLSTPSRPVLEPTQLPVQWVTGALSRGKMAGEWSWQPPNSAEVKNTWIYTSVSTHTSSWRST